MPSSRRLYGPGAEDEVVRHEAERAKPALELAAKTTVEDTREDATCASTPELVDEATAPCASEVPPAQARCRGEEEEVIALEDGEEFTLTAHNADPAPAAVLAEPATPVTEPQPIIDQAAPLDRPAKDPVAAAPPSALHAGTKRTSIHFLLCDDAEGNTTPEPPLKKRLGKTAKASSPVPTPPFCCAGCEQSHKSAQLGPLYKVEPAGVARPGVREWELPQMGAVWTRAWARRHWDARLPAADVARAADVFASMRARSRRVYDALAAFPCMVEPAGARLGHARERELLLRDFRGFHEYAEQLGSLFMREVAGQPRAPREDGPVAEGDRVAQAVVEENVDLRYLDMVEGLRKRWEGVVAHFVERMNEMEKRQDMETHATKSLRGMIS